MRVKQCHKPPTTGNGKHTIFNDWGMVYGIVLPTLPATYQMFNGEHMSFQDSRILQASNFEFFLTFRSGKNFRYRFLNNTKQISGFSHSFYMFDSDFSRRRISGDHLGFPQRGRLQRNRQPPGGASRCQEQWGIFGDFWVRIQYFWGYIMVYRCIQMVYSYDS